MGGGPTNIFELPANASEDPTLNFTTSGGSDMPNGAGKGCFYAPNLVLGAALDKYRTLTCDPGFYCPYLNATDSTTVPVLCPPSPMCVKYRLAGFPCLAQGIYEPIICRPGYYCPNYKTMLPCPQGYFCPTGTVKPFKCTIFSSCPQGSIYQVVYLFLIILAGVDGVLLLLFWGIRVKHQRMQAMASNTSRHHRYPTEGGIWHSLIGRISSLKNSWGRLMTSLFGIASTSRLRMLSQTMMHPSSSRALHEYRRDSGTASTLLMEEDFPIPEEEISRETLRHDLTVLSKAFRDTFPLHGQVRMNFRFEGLELTLKNGHKVLSGVTGKIEEGKMTAILGPSGAGKTTFMNVLMGKVDKTGGTLFINGQESEVHLYRKIIGYVPQEDIMLQELTVRENVLHSARVRLPRSWNEKKIQSHVDNVLLTLKLSHVAHSVIGDETTRGISGGQRKRVNIAMELAAAPLTIFLDEPTSGLDSTSALDATDILSSMSSLGITIIAVIHQPRIEIFEKFHNVIMVAPGGRVAYMGPVTKIKSYFRALGFEFQESANVSDAVMDILAGKGVNPACAGGKLGVDQVVELWEDRELRKTFIKGVEEQKRTMTFDAARRKKLSNSSTSYGGIMSSSTSSSGAKKRMVTSPFKAVTSHFSHGLFSANDGHIENDENGDDTWNSSWGDTLGLLGTASDKGNNRREKVARVRRLSPSGLDSEAAKKYAALDTPINTFLNKSSVSSPSRRDFAKRRAISSAQSMATSATDIPMQIMRPKSREQGVSEEEDGDTDVHSRSSFSTLVAAPLLFQSIKKYHYSTSRSISQSYRKPGFESDDSGSETNNNSLTGCEPSRRNKRQRAWKQNREFHSIAPIVVESRGAGFWKQLYHCHQRSVIQQFRKMNAFVLETVVAVIAGVLMGLSTQGKLKELYSGPYASIYAGMSPKPNDVISLFCFLLGLSVALASAPAAVKVFGEEKSVYWREAASGHSRAAYFLGKTISTLFRIAIMALHFTAVFMLLAKPVISPATQYLIVLLQYWGVYGMSCLISMVVRRENASLLAVVMCLFASVFCGYGPSITQAKRWGINWIMELSFNKWAAEAMYASSIRIYENKYNIQNTADMFGWNLYQIERDFIMCFVLGLGMRVIGFILLVVMNRDKQR